MTTGTVKPAPVPLFLPPILFLGIEPGFAQSEADDYWSNV
jgi:hypothetical protein